MHYRYKNETPQNCQQVIEQFPGQKKFPDKVVSIKIKEGNQKKEKHRVPPYEMRGNVLPGIVNIRYHVQSEPDQNMDGYGKKPRQIAGWFLHLEIIWLQR